MSGSAPSYVRTACVVWVLHTSLSGKLVFLVLAAIAASRSVTGIAGARVIAGGAGGGGRSRGETMEGSRGWDE